VIQCIQIPLSERRAEQPLVYLPTLSTIQIKSRSVPLKKEETAV
jgi:hypothetical protein